MSKKTDATKPKDLPLKIKVILDKKTQKDGNTSYLVQYKDEVVQAWSSKNYLCKDSDNKKMIQRYQMLVQLQQSIEDKQANSQILEFVASTKNRRKKHIKKNKKQSDKNNKNNEYARQIKETNNKTQQKKKKIECNTQNYSILKYLQQKEIIPQPELSQQSKIERNQVEEQQKNQSNNQKQAQFVNKKMNQDQTVKQENKLYSRIQVKQNQGFRIIKAKIDLENKIQFQVKYDNGFLVWLDGDIVKSRNPLQVIRFYEKRISWGC